MSGRRRTVSCTRCNGLRGVARGAKGCLDGHNVFHDSSVITKHFRTNEELRELFGEADIIGIMKSSRIRWAGHVWRSEGVLGSITKWKPNTKRPRGRPRQRWADRVKDDLSMIDVENAEEMSRDREKWKDVVVAPMDFNGL
ncbi:Hypothetical protein CINCED_3A019582 [Cinara cedri]|uniref:Uncharacterized protein n=1 Tax=Cinara cedri TaxID=506608 RepID=A0A5E4M3J3_9HEMI|nr:Hypothetical protein CINCED_3A019582 [Cinara cedri]